MICRSAGEDAALKPQRKIAYVTSAFPVLRQTFVSREIIELEKRGFKIVVVSLRNSRELVGKEEVPQASVIYLPYLFSRNLLAGAARVFLENPALIIRETAVIVRALWKRPIRIMKFLSVFLKCLRLIEVFKEKGVRHIHAQFATIPTTCAYFISMISGLKFSFTAHAWDIYVKGNEAFLKEKLHAADQVFTVSNFNRDYLISIGGDEEKVTVAYQGLELERYEFRDRVPEGVPLVTAGGALVEKKGLHVFIGSLAELARRGVPFRAEIFGEGRERKLLVKLVKSLRLEGLVSFVGAMPHSKVIELFQRSDIFVMASIRAKDGSIEGLPNVVAEAMACGAAVVASCLSGIPELVRDGVDGILFPPGDALALADALSKLLRDSESRARFAEQARLRVESFFDLRKNINTLASYFETALSRPGTGSSSSGVRGNYLAKGV